MSKLTSALRGLRNSTTPTVFEAMADSVIEQQISLRVARILENRVVKSFGRQLKTGKDVYFAYPAPEDFAPATLSQLQKLGLSRRKAECLIDLANMITEGRLDLEGLRLSERTEDIIRALDSMKGIGVWTAEMTTIRGIGKLDALPADDLGLRRTIAHYYADDRKISAEEARGIARRWGVWRGLAAYYLIVAERRALERLGTDWPRTDAPKAVSLENKVRSPKYPKYSANSIWLKSGAKENDEGKRSNHGGQSKKSQRNARPSQTRRGTKKNR